MRDFYWDTRPEAPSSARSSCGCAPRPVDRGARGGVDGYLHALDCYLPERSEPIRVEDDYLVYIYNRIQAYRFGLSGISCIRSYKSISLPEGILGTPRGLHGGFSGIQMLGRNDAGIIGLVRVDLDESTYSMTWVQGNRGPRIAVR